MPTIARAQTVPMNPALAKIVAAAKGEGKVSLHFNLEQTGGPPGAKVAQDGINRMFGTSLTVEWSPGPGFGPLAAEIYQNMQAGQSSATDIYEGAPAQIVPYLDRGLFRAVDFAALMPDRITPEMVEADHRALRFITLLPAILYNVQGAPWVPKIDTLSDLLKPEYKGKFDTTTFLGGFDVLLTDEIWGPQKTQDYVRKLSAQVAGLTDCSAFDRIASGEIPALAVDCVGAADNTPKFRGRNVLATRIISDMAQRRYAYLMIPTNAPHPNAAVLYALYLLSAEGQKDLVWNYWGLDLTDFPDSRSRPKVLALEGKGVKFVDVTISWWQGHPGIVKSLSDLIKILHEH